METDIKKQLHEELMRNMFEEKYHYTESLIKEHRDIAKSIIDSCNTVDELIIMRNKMYKKVKNLYPFYGFLCWQDALIPYVIEVFKKTVEITLKENEGKETYYNPKDRRNSFAVTSISLEDLNKI